MSGEVHQTERQTILTRLLDAVKQCQVRFGGRSELATDLDSRVSCLCSAWETALQHGIKKSNTALSALKQITEKSSLLKTYLFSDVINPETEPVFWHYARVHLSKDELQRFSKLHLVNTDLGRGRAWLRASLNEQALERYMLMLIESDEMLSLYYEGWAFLRDVERNSMLPVMAAGLGSILFAITVDRPELNGGHAASVSVSAQSRIESAKEACLGQEPTPVISESLSAELGSKKKEKRKKKKVTNVVVFDEDGTTGTVVRKSNLHSSLGSPSFTKQHLEGETRGHGDGTPANSMLDSEGIISSGMEGSRDPLLSALIRISNQVNSVSMGTENSSRLPDIGLSGADSRILMAAVSSDGTIMGSDLIPVCDTSSTHFWSQGIGHPTSFSGQQTETAVQGGKLAQQSLPSSNLSSKVKHNPHNVKPALVDSFSHDEMKQAVVTMIEKKDSEQELARHLESLVQQEMDVSATLKAEMEELKQQNAATLEIEQLKLQALQKENELLKHQLKKYVSAVQMLRTGGSSQGEPAGVLADESLPGLPTSKSVIDYSHEAGEYEKKLIQVAEMHGELMEFNELLHRQLGAKDVLVRQLMEELVVLRGPLPYDKHAVHNTGPDLHSVFLQRPLINIWIPSAFLRGSASNMHHVYQVYVRIQDEEWNVYRRYSQFLDTHLRLKKVYPIIGTFEFPPKKTIGKKDARLVESRRKLFQTYLRKVINLMVEKSPGIATNISKEKLILVLPFFNDAQDERSERNKK
ncbi:hypothetical protein BsWGS_21019 [Bradybaena similaris]